MSVIQSVPVIYQQLVLYSIEIVNVYIWGERGSRMTKDLGDKVSRVLEDTGRAWDQVIYNELQPPLDSELNLSQQIASEIRAENLRVNFPSGFVDPALMIGGIAGNVNSQNVIIFESPLALVNGFILTVGTATDEFQLGEDLNVWKALSGFGETTSEEQQIPTGDPCNPFETITIITPVTDPNIVVVVLPPAPNTGNREDLVFLEMWREIIDSTSNITPFGNTQYADGVVANDLEDVNIGRETTQRVQLRFRFRTETNIDFIAFRNGLGEQTIFAQGAKANPVPGFPFNTVDTDPGLFKAGDGSTTAQSDLGTIDGFVYAIPIARVARRNQTVFSTLNPNGASASLVSGISDRPDGAFHDLILDGDIEDLRHESRPQDYEQLARKTFDTLIRGELSTNLADPVISGGQRGTSLVQIDAISVLDQPGINDVQPPDGTRRIFSDAASTQDTTNKQAISGSATDITLETAPGLPAGTLLGTATPTVTDDETGTEITGSWVDLGTTSATFTPTDVLDIQGKNVTIFYTLDLPSGIGMEFAISGVLSVVDQFGATVGFNRITDTESDFDLPTPVRVINGNTDVARILSLTQQSIETKRGGVLEIDYHVAGVNTEVLIIPSQVYGFPVLSISRVFDLQTSSESVNPTITKITAGFQINLTTIIASAETIRVSLIIAGQSLDYNGNLKEISEIGRTEFLTIAGNGADTVLPASAGELVIANAGFRVSVELRRFAVFVDGTLTIVDTITGFGTPVLSLTFTTAPNNGAVIEIPIMRAKAPDVSEVLNITYSYIPYQGLSQAYPTNISLEGEILWLANETLVTTAGTGSSQAQVPIVYQGLIERLPINLVHDTGDFSGETVQTTISNLDTSILFSDGRGFSAITGNFLEGTFITVGDDIKITDSVSLGQTFYRHRRGRQLESPVITEKGPSLLASFKHLNAIYGLIKGKDRFEGELLLFVITTTGEGDQVLFNAGGTDNQTVCSADIFKIEHVPLIK